MQPNQLIQVRRLAEVAPPIIRSETPRGGGSCIFAAHAAVALLADQAIPAEVVPVRLRIAGPGGFTITTGALPGMWDGHLIAVIEDELLVDLSFYQFAHFFEAIRTRLSVPEGYLHSVPHHWRTLPEGIGHEGNGILTVYNFDARDASSWESTNAWQDDEAHERIVSAVRAALRQG